jgi:hypothetical protein
MRLARTTAIVILSNLSRWCLDRSRQGRSRFSAHFRPRHLRITDIDLLKDTPDAIKPFEISRNRFDVPRTDDVQSISKGHGQTSSIRPVAEIGFLDAESD